MDRKTIRPIILGTAIIIVILGIVCGCVEEKDEFADEQKFKRENPYNDVIIIYSTDRDTALMILDDDIELSELANSIEMMYEDDYIIQGNLIVNTNAVSYYNDMTNALIFRR
jgi:hypothetical protein